MMSRREFPAYVSYEAIVFRNEDAPDECVIRPGHAGDGRSETAWITAKEGSFCLPPDRA